MERKIPTNPRGMKTMMVIQMNSRGEVERGQLTPCYYSA